MKFSDYFSSVQTTIITNHRNMIPWFNESEELKRYKPSDSGWSISEILEHVSLTSHFLLLIIEKGAKKAIRKSEGINLNLQLENEDFDLSRFHIIGLFFDIRKLK